MLVTNLLIILSYVGFIYGQAVHNVAIRSGQPYEDIKNPEYPKGVLPHGTSIQWNLVVEADSKIKILCDDIRMGQHGPWTDECPHVYVSFDEGNGETRVCGPNKARSRYLSKGPRLTVKLVSKEGSGFFKCTAFNIKEPIPEYIDLKTGGHIKVISTTGTPTPYLDKMWIIRSPPNTRISLQCSVSLENVEPCYKEMLSIDIGEEIKEFCGYKDVTVFTKENTGKVRIQLDEHGKRNAECFIQAVTGPHANEFLNVVSEEVDSTEFGVTRGSRQTSCKCGWRNRVPGRIIGGKEVEENEFPWMVLLNIYYPLEGGARMMFYCGASVITQRHVLTAGHCVVDKATRTVVPPQDVIVRLAEHHSGKSSGKEKEISSQQIFVHENYLKKGSHDIAVIFTKDVIEFNDIIGPVCLSRDPLPVNNRRITVMGWGQTEQRRGSDVLLKAKSTVIDNLLCGVADYEICTHTIPSTACYGDSGGPLVWRDPETNRYTQVALVSRGTHTICEKGRAIATHVPSFYEWIHNIIRSTDPSSTTCNKI
uniref:Venom S1 protease 34 n=1 Tax=Platymeris rhadamanthus TaxID=1134088 RepID=A0A6B9L1L1_PLARH|nr:venom S1 protease 34 [Platymeris rhadamanthus]